MNPEQWLSLKWNGGSTMSDRWLNQSKIIHTDLVNMIHLHNLLKIIQLIRCQQKDSLTSTDSSHKWHNAE